MKVVPWRKGQALRWLHGSKQAVFQTRRTKNDVFQQEPSAVPSAPLMSRNNRQFGHVGAVLIRICHIKHHFLWQESQMTCRQPVKRRPESLCCRLLDLVCPTRFWLFQCVLWNVPWNHKYWKAVRLRAISNWQKMHMSLQMHQLQALREFCDMSWPSGHSGLRSGPWCRTVEPVILQPTQWPASGWNTNSENLGDGLQVSRRLSLEDENGLQMLGGTHGKGPQKTDVSAQLA